MKKLLLLLGCLMSIQSMAQQSAKAPDCKSAEHRQFDFWVGNWEVSDKDGDLLGHNHIKLILNDCVLQENWTGAKGSEGKSFNFYDRQTQKWHQTWIDNAGNPLYFDGGMEKDTMVLKGHRLGRDGKPVLHKLSLTPLEDGRVKQFWQASRDEGKTWMDVFLGFYKKKE